MIVAVALVGALVLAELALQVVEATLSIDGRSLVPPDARGRVVEAPAPHHPVVLSPGEDGTNPHEVNARGFRAPGFHPRLGNALRIVVLGDETTFGFGAPAIESWPIRWQDRLRDEIDTGIPVEVWNLAVPGASSWGNRRDLEVSGAILDADLVVFAWRGDNDVTLADTADAARPGERHVLGGPRPAILLPHVIRRVGRSLAPREQPIAPPAEPVARVSADEFEANLRAMAAWCAERGVPFHVVLLPSDNPRTTEHRARVSHAATRVLEIEPGADPLPVVFDALLGDVLHQATLRQVDKVTPDTGAAVPSF